MKAGSTTLTPKQSDKAWNGITSHLWQRWRQSRSNRRMRSRRRKRRRRRRKRRRRMVRPNQCLQLVVAGSVLGHQGIILVDFLPRGETTNATHCIQMLQELLCAPCDMHLQGNTHILQHKNAWPYTEHMLLETIPKYDWSSYPSSRQSGSWSPRLPPIQDLGLHKFTDTNRNFVEKWQNISSYWEQYWRISFTFARVHSLQCDANVVVILVWSYNCWRCLSSQVFSKQTSETATTSILLTSNIISDDDDDDDDIVKNISDH